MSRIFVHGLGAVSPAGWGVPALGTALKKGEPLPIQNVSRPGWAKSLSGRTVPPPPTSPAFLAHPRLRRASPITQYTVGVACEALGEDVARVQKGELRLGIIVCLMPGCVTYSRRFYEEVLTNPATASPLLFPETVFNAPASHLAAYLNSTTVNYTLVGDNGTFLQGVALAADWLEIGLADACLVIGAEEADWIAVDAVRMFRRSMIYACGAGALYLKKNSSSEIELTAITDSLLFTEGLTPAEAGSKMKAQLPDVTADELLCDNANAEESDYAGNRLTPKNILGESFVTSAAWQCVAACDLIRQKQFAAANVNIFGANQQAIGARFVRNHL